MADGTVQKQANNFATKCQRYFDTKKLLIPENKPHELVFRRSSLQVASQKPVPRRTKNTTFGTNLLNLTDTVGKISKNLNYHSKLEHWFQFYKFPHPIKRKEYIEEIKTCNPALGEFEVANQSFSSMRNYANRLITLNEHERCGVNFLEGTTGVGKTTFLKFFVKSQKPHFLNSMNIISRVKFDDVENLYKSNKGKAGFSLQAAFAKLLIDRLFRDVIDSYLTAIDIWDMNPTLKVRLKHSHNFPVEDINIEIIDKLQALYNDTRRFYQTSTKSTPGEIEEGLKSREVDFLQKVPRDFCRQVISNAKKAGFKFCILLDGFDALRPEDIMLFGSDRQTDFSECLSSAIKNVVDTGGQNGELINSLDKIYVVAARPVTIIQLRREMNPEVNFDTLFETSLPTFVIGSDIFGILKNRIKVRLDISRRDQPSNLLFEGLEDGINTVVNVIYDNHPTIEKGRFIDLFNHNIREKLLFLQNTIEFLTIKVENAYYDFLVKNGLPDTSPLLNQDIFRSYLALTAEDLSIELYEVQKLLLLQNDGVFKNKFEFDLSGKELVYQKDAGPFENIFNYLPLKNRKKGAFKKFPDEVLEKKPTKYDPILIKYVTLLFLAENATEAEPLPMQILSVWLKTTYSKHELEDCDLQTLIRSDCIRPTLNGNEVLLSCTRKGLFTVRELIKTTIYIEHALLNVIIPQYVKKHIEAPMDETPRVWARISMTNIVVFFMYLKSVAKEMQVGNEKISTLNIESNIEGVYGELCSKFAAIAAQGIKKETDKSGIVYKEQLDKFKNYRNFN